MIDVKKMNLSNRIYPLFYGLTLDLIFWIAINTLFLSTVRNLNASEINSLTTISILIAIIVQINSLKIIKKIGNINSIKLGTFMLLIASIFLTFSRSYLFILVGYIFYNCSFIFIQMNNVVLMKNLKKQNKSDEYAKIQTKGSIIYSFLTMIISFISGFLFNINVYLPMIIMIIVCFGNVILSHFIYEVDNESESIIIEQKNKIGYSKLIFFIIILYGVFYSAICVGQSNSKLFIQDSMLNFLDISQVAIYLSLFLTISRIVRLISDLFFMKLYKKMKNKILIYLEIILLLSFLLLLLGNFIGNGMLGIWIMAIGFFLFLSLRNPFDTYMKTILFENSDASMHSKLITQMALSRKIGELLFSGIIALILLKFSYVYVMCFMLILVATYLILEIKILKLFNLKFIND